jgi:hypothetical protein
LDAFQAIRGGTLLDAPVHGPMATSPLVLVSARHARYFSARRNEFGTSLVSGVSIPQIDPMKFHDLQSREPAAGER